MVKKNKNRVFTVSEWRDRMVESCKSKLSFSGKTRGDYRNWRGGFEKEFRKLLGLFPDPVPLQAEIIERKVFPTYVREKVVFNSEQFMSVPAWICSPKKNSETVKHPAVVCCHGHGLGKDALAGILSNGKSGVDYQKRLAVELAENGYVAIAPDWRCFGERREPPENLTHPRDICDLAHVTVESFGYNLLTLDIWDGMKTVDYLETRDDVDRSRIGCVGCSFGGTMAMFLSAADSRISAACVSGYLMATGKCSFTGTCGSQTLPGLLALGDRAEVAGLICPRPLLIQIGEYDSTFPACHALKEYERLQHIYRTAGIDDRLGLDRFDGCHEIHLAPILEWFDRWLTERRTDD